MDKPLDRNGDDTRCLDLEELRRFIQRMRGVRLGEARLVREIERLGQSEPNPPPQEQTGPCDRPVAGPDDPASHAGQRQA